MELTTFQEDLISNAVLALLGLCVVGLRDLCKRVSHSHCRYDAEHGLDVRLPTWHDPEAPEAPQAEQL